MFPGTLKNVYSFENGSIRTIDWAMMSRLLAPAPPSTAKPVTSTWRKSTPLKFGGRVNASSRGSHESPEEKKVRRRGVLVGLVGVAMVMNGGEMVALAAARRPPPPPPEEKKDPNLTGLAAKVSASKKRKEALKQYIAKQREKGKPVEEPSE